jgi:alpha-D-ribose 1-methylphosphonate 5-triphosphate synthase subunit PhnG
MKVSDSQTELRKGLQIIADSEDEELVQVIESNSSVPKFRLLRSPE